MRKKRKKKSDLKNKFILAISWIVICSAFGYFLPTIPIFKNFIQIKKVELEGTTKIDMKALKKIFENESWFTINENKLKTKLKNYKFIKSVKIEKPEIGKIKLKIEERKPFAYVKYKNDINIIDNNGIILDKNDFSPQELKNIHATIIINSNTFKKDFVKKVLKIRKEFKTFKIKKYIIGLSEVAVVLKDKHVFVFSLDNFDKDLDKAKLFFSKKNPKKYRYINFSFDSMVVARR